MLGLVQSALGNENQYEEVGDLVRGDLCTSIAMILQVSHALSLPFLLSQGVLF